MRFEFRAGEEEPRILPDDGVIPDAYGSEWSWADVGDVSFHRLRRRWAEYIADATTPGGRDNPPPWRFDEREEHNMPTPNPYDRRRSDHDRVRRGFFDAEPRSGQVPTETFLTLADFDAAAQHAAERAARSMRDRLERKHYDEVREAQMVAWDKGHATGGVDVLLSLDQQAGRIVREGLSIARVGIENEKATPDELRQALTSCAEALEAALQAHHGALAQRPGAP